ncbi:MAG: DMT family transporter [Promethearchaeota archaeon]
MIIENIIGVVLALLATILFNLGPIYQKSAVDKMEEIKGKNFLNSIISMFKNAKWLLGTIFGVLGGVPYFFALQIAGITIVQPVLNFGFIIMVYYAKKWFNENLDLSGKLGITLLIIMPLFITLGGVSEPNKSFSNINLIIYTSLLLIIALIFFIGTKKINILWAPTCGVCFSIGALYMQAFTLPINFENFDILFQTALSALWLAILSGIFNSLGMFLGQIGLQRNPASKYNPINQTINNIASFIGGIIVFSQSVSNIFIYSLGFLLGIIGVFLLGRYDIQNLKKEK